MGDGVRGKELTPFLLGRLAEITEGQTLAGQPRPGHRQRPPRGPNRPGLLPAMRGAHAAWLTMTLRGPKLASRGPETVNRKPEYRIDKSKAVELNWTRSASGAETW